MCVYPVDVLFDSSSLIADMNKRDSLYCLLLPFTSVVSSARCCYRFSVVHVRRIMNAETSTYYDYYHHLYYYYHYIRVLAFVLFFAFVCVSVCVYTRIYIDFHFFPVSPPFSETNKERKN